MVRQLYDVLLHKKTHHTNYFSPKSEYVTNTKFPKQDISMLASEVVLKYRNHYIPDFDEEELSDVEKIDPHDIYENKFIVVRFDITEPYVMISISKDFMFCIVSDSRYYKNTVEKYPVQISKYIGITVYNQFVATREEIRGATIRVDNGEPTFSVIAEILSDGSVRVLLGDECYSKLYDYYDELLRDYNGKGPKGFPNPIDLNGGYSDYKGKPFTVIDGGIVDPLKYIHTLTKEKTKEEVVAIRKQIFEGRIIYGSNKVGFTKA